MGRPPLKSVRLLDRLRERIRCAHYSLRTEKANVSWVRSSFGFTICVIPKLWDPLRSNLSCAFSRTSGGWDAPARLRGRHPTRAGAARAQRCEYNHDLHARAELLGGYSNSAGTCYRISRSAKSGSCGLQTRVTSDKPCLLPPFQMSAFGTRSTSVPGRGCVKTR
jgi:hypothetical protein